jgi:hypothetical protein
LITTRSPVDSTARVHRHPLWKRKLTSASRWLHLYLSMVGFAIVLFFAATGFTLNHQDWFTQQQRTIQTRGTLDPRWMNGPDQQIDKLRIVEHLRAADRIQGALDDFRIDGTQCSVSFKGPGTESDIVIDRASGKYDLTTTRAGFVAILNDLHKGRDTGKVWTRVIDISAILMTSVSLTGIVLVLFLHKRSLSGILILAAGAVLVYLIYAIWVP